MKVGQTTWPLRYDLNQIPYNYTVEGTNRFKGLDLVDKSTWRTMDGGPWHCTEDSDQDHPQEKEMQKVKWLSEEVLQTAEKRRWAKGKGEKESSEGRVPKNSKERKKAFLHDQCKETEENNRMGKTRGLIKKIRDTKGTLHPKMGTIKDRNVWT